MDRKTYDKQLLKWVKDHYWDSLEKDKDLILRHLRTFTGDIEAEFAVSAIELNGLGRLLKNRIERKHTAKLKNRNVENWGRCLEIEGEIFVLEGIWEELMGRGLLT